MQSNDKSAREHADRRGWLEMSDARNRGNAAYKAGKLLEAINLYGIAHEEDPTDSRPLANRSACWFERGAYDEAAMDSDRALSLVAEGERAKLLCRAGKAHLFAGHVDSAAACFSEAERTGGLDEACTRFAAALQVVDAAASIGPCELPVCRPAPVTVLEYYASSNERARSAFGGRVTRDDSGHHEEQKEDRLLLRGKQGVAAFFGGCGDGRHVMHTLMDAHEQLAQLSARERHDYKLALILNDHCPASLARVFVLLVLVEQFGAAAYRQRVCIAEEDEDVARGGEPSQRMTQLAKDVYARSWLLYYTQLGAFLPPALATALQEILATYSRGRPPRWIRCDERTWQSVQQILDAWANTPLTAKWMDRMYEPPSMQASGHSRHSPTSTRLLRHLSGPRRRRMRMGSSSASVACRTRSSWNGITCRERARRRSAKHSRSSRGAAVSWRRIA